MQSERDRLAPRIEGLRRRAHLNRTIRAFFGGRGFLEIEAPILVPSPGLELHLEAFTVENAGAARYLITSPEYQMKRLLAGGLPRIYSLGKVFRRGELGRQHHPEFTLLEWYRARAPWTALVADLEALVHAAAYGLNGTSAIGGLDVAPPWDRLSVGDAFERFAGVRLFGDESLEALRDKLQRAGHRLPEGGGWDDVFFAVFLDVIEGRLGVTRPLVLYDWPRPLCALARERPDDPRVVERFEVYAGGLELCNGFGELNDPVEQRRRFEADREERRRRGLAEYPIDERLLAALADMPPAAGVAVGVDRLLMLLSATDQIRNILPFAVDEL
jgi:lysyl-tRNA synthetase class 2